MDPLTTEIRMTDNAHYVSLNVMFLRAMTEHEDAPIPLLATDTQFYLGFLDAVIGASSCVLLRR